jgi:hypothetical protein
MLTITSESLTAIDVEHAAQGAALVGSGIVTTLALSGLAGRRRTFGALGALAGGTAVTAGVMYAAKKKKLTAIPLIVPVVVMNVGLGAIAGGIVTLLTQPRRSVGSDRSVLLPRF